MTPCEQCGKTSTVHICRPKAGEEPIVIHLCNDCAEAAKLIHASKFQLPEVLQLLMEKNTPATSEGLSRLVCPACGIKYMDFRQNGRLGCPHDYESFRNGLESLLERIHRKTIHIGKRPKRTGPVSQTEILELRRKLKEAVEQEEYEQAARLRDLIRQKERVG